MRNEHAELTGYHTASGSTQLVTVPTPRAPIALGYARLIDHAAIEQQYRVGLWFGAIAGGLDLRGIYVDDFWRMPSVYAFQELVEHVQQEDIHHVIVPSLRHFTIHRAFQRSTLDFFTLLEIRVWTVIS